MSNFKQFQEAIERKFDKLKAYQLFRVQVSKDQLWETYLKSFPEGTNPMFKERTEHDCQCCKSFIRAVGDVVAIVNGKLVSIWDVEIDGFYQTVTNKLSELVTSRPIQNQFLHPEGAAGKKENYTVLEGSKGVITWNHFHLRIPSSNFLKGEDIGAVLGESLAQKSVLYRSLNEITEDSVKTVLELISQNSLYKGEENKHALQTFQKLQTDFKSIPLDQDRDIFCWSKIKTIPASVSKIRNTSIGTLLVDLSEGNDLEGSVASYEVKVAPANYKRPKALVTKAMVQRAEKKIEELGLMSSLERRYATVEDITVNNILYVDKAVKPKMKGSNVFGELSKSIPTDIKTFDKVEEIGIEAFINNVIPTANSIELLVENRHTNNMVSLISPVDPDSKPMFKWPNKFSWSYNGEVTDSIKERVKKAGGKVDGDLRCSLSWFNHDDLDLHMVEPGGYRIFYGSKYYSSPNGGNLDVDMNAGGGTTRSPVENICYLDRNRMKEGVYELRVNQFLRREKVDVGFEVEIEFDGRVHTLSYPESLVSGGTIHVANIKYSKKNGFEILESLPSTQTSKEVWNVPTHNFHKVNMIMHSPNHWDGVKVGNKHYFFMLDNCLNEGKARGFYNEFLSEELSEHRKVLELVGAKMRTEESSNQLSGLGFSSTQRNQILCRVNGTFSRVVKVLF